MKRWIAFAAIALAALMGVGCATLDETERTWIFQPSDATWGRGAELAQGGETLDGPGGSSGLVEGGQEDRDEQGDDADDHQQFDQRKRPARLAGR